MPFQIPILFYYLSPLCSPSLLTLLFLTPCFLCPTRSTSSCFLLTTSLSQKQYFLLWHPTFSVYLLLLAAPSCPITVLLSTINSIYVSQSPRILTCCTLHLYYNTSQYTSLIWLFFFQTLRVLYLIYILHSKEQANSLSNAGSCPHSKNFRYGFHAWSCFCHYSISHYTCIH